MIETIDFDRFNSWFINSENYKNKYSYEARKALYDYLLDFEDSTGEQMEFDPIALCCDFTEYKNLAELQTNYTNIKSMEELQGRTTVIPIYDSNGLEMENFIIANF